jgi:hypothetical protein
MDETLTPDEERFMRWLEEDVVGHEFHMAPPPPHWEAMRDEVERLGAFLRLHLPEAVQLPDPVLFNEQIQSRLTAGENDREAPPSTQG